MKDIVKRRTIQDPEPVEGFDELTAQCHACGDGPVGVGTPTYLLIPGMVFHSPEYDVPVFVPDTDAKIKVLEYPNGQLGFVTDETTTKYAHQECIDGLIEEAACEDEEDEDEDEEDDEEEESEDYE